MQFCTLQCTYGHDHLLPVLIYNEKYYIIFFKKVDPLFLISEFSLRYLLILKDQILVLNSQIRF